jgi:ferritin-like metal-binding protein YciE
MTIRKLDDLFLTELQETYAAEKLIVAPLSKLAMTIAEPSTGFINRSPHRIGRLEQIFGLFRRQPDAASKQPPMGGILAEIDELMGIEPTTPGHAAAVRSVVETVRHYLMARYVTLASWANELRMPEVSKLISATLEEERARSGPPADQREQDNGKGVSLGERLTAMFDRKR